MFQALHRIVVVGFWSLLALGVWLVYVQRARLRPVIDEVAVLQQLQLNSDPSRAIGHLVGTVVQVTGPDSFRIRRTDGIVYHFRLEVAQASREPTPEARQCREEARSHLSGMILSNHVRVEMTYTNEYRLGLGFVFCKGTNVGVEMVRAGHARINPDQIKGLPLAEQHEFLLAQQQAQEAGRGLWR